MICRAVLEGARAIAADDVREMVLPRLSGQTGDDEAYGRYFSGAYFWPAASRARALFRGLMQSAPTQITAPPAAKEFLSDVTGSDVPLNAEEFKNLVETELVTTGFCGVLTDFPRVGGPPEEGGLPRDLTTAQADRRGVRPTWTLYRAEDIVNWGFLRLGGRTMLGLLILHEWRRLSSGEDEFDRPRVEQWRVLDLAPPSPDDLAFMPRGSLADDGGSGLAYRVRIFRLKKKANDSDPDEFELISTAFPRRDGQLMTSIQFDPAGAEENTFRLSKPPLFDAVDVNVAWFRNSASYEHALLWVGNPQAVIYGYDPEIEGDAEGMEPEASAAEAQAAVALRRVGVTEKREWRFGSPEILLIKSHLAKGEMFSLKSDDVSALKDAKDDKKAELVMLVGRMLAAESQANIAERTEQLQRSADQGVIANIQQNSAKAMTRALGRALDWMKLAGERSFSSAVDYFQRMLTPEEASAISDLALKGHLAQSDVRDLLRRGGWIRPGRTDEQIDQEIEQQGPRLGMLGNMSGLVPIDGKVAPPTPSKSGAGNPAPEGDREAGGPASERGPAAE